MPMCARCSGVALGQIGAIVIAVALAFPPYWACVLLLLPMLVDWSLQEYANILSNNPRRFVTGLVGGLGFSSFLFRVLVELARALGETVLQADCL